MSVGNIGSVLASAGQATDRRSIGKNEFLTLLVTQLKNQDPLSPLQPHEFAAQLAQFTSVEQLTQVNATMARQEESLAMATLLSKTSFSAALLGRQVVAGGGQVAIPAEGTSVPVRIDVGGTGGHATLTLRDSGGRTVATRDLGMLAGGVQTLALPADLPAGTYRYAIAVAGAGGQAVPVTTYTTGVVQGIAFRDGRILLSLGGIEIELDDLTEIAPAAPAAATDPGAPIDLTRPGEPAPLPAGPPAVGDLRRVLGLG
jgi:flagellar basal-body rod modification protein FlgD